MKGPIHMLFHSQAALQPKDTQKAWDQIIPIYLGPVGWRGTSSHVDWVRIEAKEETHPVQSWLWCLPESMPIKIHLGGAGGWELKPEAYDGAGSMFVWSMSRDTLNLLPFEIASATAHICFIDGSYVDWENIHEILGSSMQGSCYKPFNGSTWDESFPVSYLREI